MVVTPPAPRFTVSTTFDGTQVEIPARRNWFLALVMGFWLCGWAVGEVVAASFLFGPLFGGPPFEAGEAAGRLAAGAFLLVWLCGWTVGGVVVIGIWLWNLIGKEIVAAERGLLTLTKQLGPIRLPRRYELDHIRNLRYGLVPVRGRRRQSLSHQGAIAFDYGARAFRFATGIEEAEGQYLLDVLHPLLPRSARETNP